MTDIKIAAHPDRLREIDILRGLVIVLMALDHVRDYFHVGAFTSNPLDPDTTTPWLYATRWITHLCAPTFVLLTGVSAALQRERGKGVAVLSWLLATRGVWLIFLELTILSFGWSFGYPYPLFLQVIWAIGWSMLALAALVWLPRRLVFAIGLAIVVGHNLLDAVTPQQFGGAALVWNFLHEGGPIFLGETPIGLFAYPVLPWIGVIALGYGLGGVFSAPAERRDRALLFAGIAMLTAFVLLRWFELYGNPSLDTAGGPFGGPGSWRAQDTPTAAAMVFFDVQKYPPSLQFLLVTLGAVFALWPLLARLRGPLGGVLNTFGAVPFFFYLLHIYLVHALAIAANAAMGRDASGMFNYMMNVFVAPERFQGLGFSLPWVYAAWLVVLTLLYPLCRWFAALKARRRDWWLSYL
jgi:uncharacterized membrane protein